MSLCVLERGHCSALRTVGHVRISTISVHNLQTPICLSGRGTFLFLFLCMKSLTCIDCCCFACSRLSAVFHFISPGLWEQAPSWEDKNGMDSSVPCTPLSSRCSQQERLCPPSAAWQTLINTNVLPSSISRWVSAIDLNVRTVTSCLRGAGRRQLRLSMAQLNVLSIDSRLDGWC